MGELTPAGLAHKLAKLAGDVPKAQSRALGARALVTKQTIVAAAVAENRSARPRWVNYRIVGDVAMLRLRGGMAHLTELGSYKKPGGWEETPRRKGALSTPEGPRASVMHPALRARRFWQKGIAAARGPGRRAYEKVLHDQIAKTLR